MKIFRITLRSSNYYTREVQAKDFADAKQQAEKELWHGNFVDWGSDYVVSDVYYVEEIE